MADEDKKGVGEECWSHAQCWRAEANSHCRALVCTCDKGFHNYNGKCSRNIWEDLGLHQWELMVLALVLALIALAIFVGCVYLVMSKLARYRQTSPEAPLEPGDSFDHTATTKVVEQHVVASQVIHQEHDLPAVRLVEPRFIKPLSYKNMSECSSMCDASSRRSRFSDSRSSSTTSASSGWGGWAWHRQAWAALATEDYRRNGHFREGTASPTGTTRLPLLLRSATLESDEST